MKTCIREIVMKVQMGLRWLRNESVVGCHEKNDTEIHE